jgi:pilus assembly protein CpaE
MTGVKSLNVLSKHTSGVHVLPSPGSFNGHAPATPESISRLLKLIRGLFDFVIIDGGQSLDDSVLKALELSDKVLIVTVLGLPSLANTDRLLKAFTSMGFPRREKVKIVVNRYFKKSPVSVKDAEDVINKDIFWTIPNDYKRTTAAINKGNVLSHQIAPRAAITKSLLKLTENLTSKGYQPEKRWWGFLRG